MSNVGTGTLGTGQCKSEIVTPHAKVPKDRTKSRPPKTRPGFKKRKK